MEDLLPYYERELVLLRRYASEFAGRFPRVAGRLRSGGDDPQVERVLQGVALLSARVAKRLDDGYPQFTEALLEALFPHYLRPFPSCAIASFESPRELSTVRVIPRGTELHSAQSENGVHCRFRTTTEVTLAPLDIAAATFEPLIAAPAGTRLPSDATAALSITIRSESQRCSLASVALDRLRVHIDGDPSFCAALRDALFMHAGAAFVEAEDGRWIPLPAVPLAAVGFADEEALIPYGDRSHPAWRVLTEFFCFPDKHRFFDVDLAALRPLMLKQARSVTLHLALSQLRPDGATARMLRMLEASNLRLFCTPVVNLFRHAAKPIAVTHTSADYAVVPDVARPQAYEVYTVDSVRKLGKGSEGSVEFSPPHAPGGAARQGYHWTLRHDEMVAAVSPGYEKRMSLIDADADVDAQESTIVSVGITCTNRDLPMHMMTGTGGRELVIGDIADGLPIRLLAAPSGPCRAAPAQAHQRLISYLTLSHHALVPDGLPALHELLRLHDLPQSPITQRMIDGIVGLDHAVKTAWMRHDHGSSLAYGIEVRITIDEEAFAGSGIHLFAQVMDQFLALYVQVNHFVELVLLSQRQKREILRCKRRSGNASLA
ncbi:type VI secretion system protein ImpG [Pseudoduganella flava]|uniref:Type VI secretion system baseplate subunit TssF n=1 Tax=Pseudoduganella flava TaxID=871742 RepID=A0A562PLE6_9BURK|nr:type VI secretion system baseplate subunit TssF [Pseudoduganella flava]QGZ41010.1 type VI secretion system baseplate subunit TssF [Pseudoduganella flava]TWI45302.1 type VI secretion system protein ImpG [Pseudoduganella flava]